MLSPTFRSARLGVGYMMAVRMVAYSRARWSAAAKRSSVAGHVSAVLFLGFSSRPVSHLLAIIQIGGDVTVRKSKSVPSLKGAVDQSYRVFFVCLCGVLFH